MNKGFYVPPASPASEYNMNIEWKFYKPKSDTWPLKIAVNGAQDSEGKFFYEIGYDDSSWKAVSVPHTFNDEDSFDDFAQDAGEGNLYRGITLYRKHFNLPEEDQGKKVFIEFEGIRQAAYVYLNGALIGYYEAGVAPFGFDLSKHIRFGEDNVIAVAADNTSSRGMKDYMKETKPGTEPGSNTGVNFQWNAKDFNPILGGLTRNIKLYVKHSVYQTLPLYSNLKTKGLYAYCSDVDVASKKATIHVESEVRNEAERDEELSLEVAVVNHKGERVRQFHSGVQKIAPVTGTQAADLTAVSKDDYENTDTRNEIDFRESAVIKASAAIEDIRLWSPDDPYLYNVYAILKRGGEVLDVCKVQTGFRKVEARGGAETGGIFINDKFYWLTGYSHRASNEWAAIGVAPDWLKEFDAQLIRESNANFMRWMHIAAQPGDIRACDKYGIVCVQPAGDKEKDTGGRQWKQRVETMRDVIIYFRNSPSVVFYEAGNNAVSPEHMKDMVDLRKELDPAGNGLMGCRSLENQEAVDIAEYVSTMLGRKVRDAKGYTENGLITRDKKAVLEVECHREEASRRTWDDFSPPDFDFVNKFTGSNGNKEPGKDAWDLTSEDLVVSDTASYHEFYSRRVQAESKTPYYSSMAAICWSDSNQHGRQTATENARMSGRVDPVRIKKPSFFAHQVLQSEEPAVFVVGHWNYPLDPNAYVYRVKDPVTHEYTDETALRDAANKTVYVVASHCAKVELFVSGQSKGICESPKNSFLYEFPGINIMEHGYIEAIAYGEEGRPAAKHRIETAGEPARIRLTPVTGPEGLRADGSDVAFFDVEVVDEQGRVCPLDFDRIDFETDGPAVFLGGYNSGVKDLKHDKSYVYGECGTNRVFIRSTRNPGTVTVTAIREGMEKASVSVDAVPVDVDSNGLSTVSQQAYPSPLPDKAPEIRVSSFVVHSSASLQKYSVTDSPEAKKLKIYVNDKEVNFGDRVHAYKMVGAYGPAFLVLEALGVSCEYDWSAQKLTAKNGDNTVETAVKDSTMVVNGEPGIINDWPEMIDDTLYIELSAVIPALGITTYWGTDNASYYITLA